jgi:uncharacterized low-complexity protein
MSCSTHSRSPTQVAMNFLYEQFQVYLHESSIHFAMTASCLSPEITDQTAAVERAHEKAKSMAKLKQTDLQEYGIRILIAELVKFRRNDLAGATPSCGVVHDDKGTSGGLDGLVEGVGAVNVHHTHGDSRRGGRSGGGHSRTHKGRVRESCGGRCGDGRCSGDKGKRTHGFIGVGCLHVRRNDMYSLHVPGR